MKAPLCVSPAPVASTASTGNPATCAAGPPGKASQQPFAPSRTMAPRRPRASASAAAGGSSPVNARASLGLMREAKVVVTDSGGMQEETTALGTPCITVRDNTERPITISEGTNTLIGADPSRIGPIVEDILATGGKTGRKPALWDGKAAERIAAEVEAFLTARLQKA